MKNLINDIEEYKAFDFAMHPKTKDAAKEIYLSGLKIKDKITLVRMFADFPKDDFGIARALKLKQDKLPEFRTTFALSLLGKPTNFGAKEMKGINIILQNKLWNVLEKWSDEQELEPHEISIDISEKNISENIKRILLRTVGAEIMTANGKTSLVFLSTEERNEKLIELNVKIYEESMSAIKKSFEDGSAQKLMDKLGIQR